MSSRVEYEANGYGVSIRKCCASCIHKGQTRLMTKRRCMEHEKDVSPKSCCSLWQMSDQMKAAGLGLGKVKRKAYLDYLASVRETEQQGRQIGLTITSKTNEEIRRVFEKEYDTIYYNI